MRVEVRVAIAGTREAIWAAITDVEHAAEFTRGIEKIEILERPARGLVGLAWRETRILFGKPASADKRVTEAVENEFYRTRAEDDGCVYLTTLRITGGAGGEFTLTSTHDSEARGVLGKVMLGVMGVFFRGVARKALVKDLEDVKALVEGKGTAKA